ncbi:MAG: hypothetical protein HQ592_12000 [Planctomycetes bacterium]|nr:hypothetical protein [Planctomycetota bacterium]
MRRKREAVLPFEWNNDHLPKTVREYREKYKGISRLLDENPEILDRVHMDLKKLSQGGRGGRNTDFTSKTILRALVVHAMEGLSLRGRRLRGESLDLAYPSAGTPPSGSTRFGPRTR